MFNTLYDFKYVINMEYMVYLFGIYNINHQKPLYIGFIYYQIVILINLIFYGLG